MSSPASTPVPARLASWRRGTFALVLGAVLLVATIAIWWRNHDILRDLYDASSVIAGVGKLEAGLKPYADFRSTMQTATYWLNAGAEALFGSHYLGLVKGGLVLNLCGGLALAWLWRRSFPPVGAVLLAGAVTLAGLAPHVFVFYNPVGVLCLAAVWAGLSAEPRFRPWRGVDAGLVSAALVVGGMNKINFHCLTLAVAGLLVAQSVMTGRQSLKSAAASGAWLIGLGLFAPIGLELAWTGASLSAWSYNVLELPSERVGFALAGFSTDLLWQPPYDVHHSVIFKPFGAAGAGLVLIAAALAWNSTRRLDLPSLRRAGSLVLLVVTVTALLAGGFLLTTTNVEIITLTSLAFPVGAAALVAAHRRDAARPLTGFAGGLVPAVSILWIVVGGYASWQGSRVIFGDTPPRREAYVRLESPSPAAAYLRGVRLEPGWHDALLATIKEIERIEQTDPQLAGVLFGPAFEWMERAYPASRVPDMPVWYHHGTSLSSDDGPWLEARLREKGVQRLILNPNWESWPGSFWLHLATEFRSVDLSRFTRVYERKGNRGLAGPAPAAVELKPWSFREHTGSNVHWGSGRISEGVALFDGPWGRFAGRIGGLEWTWNQGPFLAQGNFVLLYVGDGAPAVATCRILGLGGGDAAPLFEETHTLSRERPEIRLPFQVSAGGNPIRLSIETDTDGTSHVLGGWRDLRIGHAGDAPAPPPAIVAGLSAMDPTAAISGPVIRLPAGVAPADGGWHPAPFEFWQPVAAGRHAVTVSLDLQRRPDRSGHPTLLTLAWYKAGRIEFLRQTIVHPEDRDTLELSAGLPESGGWVGVLGLAADPTLDAGIRARLPDWRW